MWLQDVSHSKFKPFLPQKSVQKLLNNLNKKSLHLLNVTQSGGPLSVSAKSPKTLKVTVHF